MARETYFPISQYLCHNAKVVHAFEANTPFEKLPGTQINVPRLNLHKRPRHRRCPTSRDFVPWRFSDAGRRSAWIASSCRHPKPYTLTDIASQQPTWTDQSFERLFATHFRMRTQQLGVHVAACFCRAETREGRCDRRLDRPWLPTC